MKEYTLKRGFKPDIERIQSIIKENFSNATLQEDDKIIASYGAISKLTVFIENKKMLVDTESDKTIKDDAIILDTNKRFRTFLTDATGYSAKERIKKSKQIE
jgi:hypothetical protein